MDSEARNAHKSKARSPIYFSTAPRNGSSAQLSYLVQYLTTFVFLQEFRTRGSCLSCSPTWTKARCSCFHTGQDPSVKKSWNFLYHNRSKFTYHTCSISVQEMIQVFLSSSCLEPAWVLAWEHTSLHCLLVSKPDSRCIQLKKLHLDTQHGSSIGV